MARTTATADACRAATQLGRTVDRALDESVLTPAAYRLLAYLSTGRSAAAVLAEKLAVSRPTITATTDWLVTRGLATRQADGEDRRKVAIEMTHAGAEALARADQLVAERLMEVLTPLDDIDRDEILRALDRLLGALNDYRVRRHEQTKGGVLPHG